MLRRHLKFGIAVALVLVTLALIFIFSLRKQTMFCSVTAMEYSVSDPGYTVAHKVLIDGTYSRRLTGKETFCGTFFISDLGLEQAETATISFVNHVGNPIFYDAYGQPVTTQIYQVWLDEKSNVTIISLFDQFSYENGRITATFSGDRFICIGNKSRTEAIKILHS